MNSLEKYITEQQLNPDIAMNELMEAGLVSDNAVNPADVASRDCFAACKFLELSRKNLQMRPALLP